MSFKKFATKALHAGHDVSKNFGIRAIPIYQSTAYVFDNSDHAANLFSLAEPGIFTPQLTILQMIFWSSVWLL